MTNAKKELSRFLIWLRNGICFCTTWFLILMLIFGYASENEAVPIRELVNMLLWTAGGVFIFCVFFTKLLIRKRGFTFRLTAFMLIISVYECICFYCTGIFGKKGTPAQWLIFICIILALYLICIAIYQIYSKKQGELFTSALKKYQQERRNEDG